MARILICDDQEMMRDSLAATLAREGHEVVAAYDGAGAVQRLSGGKFDLLITDLKMPKMTGMELLAEAKRLRPDMPVILMTAFATVQTAVEAMKQGAYDYIQKPFDGDEIKLLVERTLEHARLKIENAAYRSMSESTAVVRPLVGGGEKMKSVKQTIERVARSTATVLVRGESGTGKEVVARAIHAASDRRDRPFLAVNCAALSENLLESELFGHEKGAFTGADKLRRGRFELADGGTLLLDEISEIAPALQAKLLRVLQESSFERVGSSVTQQVDVRVIATSNRDLEAEVAAGRFRQDLFYRLNVVPIELPTLAERREDVVDLAGYFLEQIARKSGQQARRLEAAAAAMLAGYSWPGNVRELQNIIERACVLEQEPGVVRGETLEPWLKCGSRGSTPAAVMEGGSGGVAGLPVVDAGTVEVTASKPVMEQEPRPLAEIEKEVIIGTLRKFRGHRVKTATALGIGVRTLGMKIKKWKEDGVLVED